MSDRLAEIQRHIDTEPVTLYGLDVAELASLCIQVDEDRTWLLARVRELEAQAAVNNAAENVVTQASTLTPWEWRHVAQRLWTERGSSKETAAMTALAIALEFYEKKRAALAAREEE